MRLNGLALVASALVLAACGGGDNANTDTGAATATPAATTPATGDTGAAAGGAAAGGAATGTGTAAAITGTTHEVMMIGDDKGYRFEPAKITVKAGDGIRYVFVSGGPHNVAFDENAVPADMKAQLDANIQGEKIAPMASRMLNAPNEVVTVSFANVKPGTYKVVCQPHAAMNMFQDVTVQ